MITNLEQMKCCISCAKHTQYFGLYDNKLRVVAHGECSVTRKLVNPIRDCCEKWELLNFEKEKQSVLDDMSVLTKAIHFQINNILLILKEMFD